MNNKQLLNILPNTKLVDLLFENPSLLLMMEHFNLDYVVQNKTIEQVCTEKNIKIEIFICFLKDNECFSLVILSIKSIV
jgi:hypothetical protein